MSSAVGKVLGAATVKASRSSINTIDLKRRKIIADAGLTASKTINMNRMTDYIEFKAQKAFAIKRHGILLTDLESLKYCFGSEDEAQSIPLATLKKYSQSIMMEKIAHSAFKASKILNWKFDKNRKWGNVADAGFEMGNIKIRKEWAMYADNNARRGYINEAFGVILTDLTRLSSYARKIFNISIPDGHCLAGHAIAIESIVYAAAKSLQDFYTIQNGGKEATEPVKRKLLGEEGSASDHVAPLKFRLVKKCEKEINSDDEDDYDDYEDVGFMKSRDEMSIFMDSEEAQKQIAIIPRLFSSSSPINWSRLMKFMEFKARKEYAMEIYGVKLGDFESLKENAFKLFEINEAEAESMASETMAMDFQSLVVEKIADAAFKSSKILNWISSKKNFHQVPQGILADAGFKSAKTLMNFHRKKDVEAYKAYTMETFGVNLVDIEHLKNYALDTFSRYAVGCFNEQDAIITACQTIAVDKLFDITFKALNSTLHNNQLVEPKEEVYDTDRAMLGFRDEDSTNFIRRLAFFI